MKYSSYSLLKSTILPVSFTLYDGENSIFRAPHQALGRTLPFAILLYSHDSRCNLTVDSRTFQVEPGEGIVLPHNVRHDFCMPRAGHITWIHIFITAAGIPLMDLLKLRRCERGRRSKAAAVHYQHQHLLQGPGRQRLPCARQYHTHPAGGYGDLRPAAQPLQTHYRFASLRHRLRVFKLLSHINSHLDEPYTLRKLLDISGLSNRRCEKCSGITLIRRRLTM